MNNTHFDALETTLRMRTPHAGTGKAYFDRSYPRLIRAGAELRNKPNDQRALELAHVLADGLAGWNTGPLRWRAANRVLEGGAVRLILDLDGGRKMATAVGMANDNLGFGGNRVSMASKLLHWLWPSEFCIFDSKMLKSLPSPWANSGPTVCHYVEFMTGLVQLGLVGSDARPDDERSWTAGYHKCALQHGVSVLRVVDATLWRAP